MLKASIIPEQLTISQWLQSAQCALSLLKLWSISRPHHACRSHVTTRWGIQLRSTPGLWGLMYECPPDARNNRRGVARVLSAQGLWIIRAPATGIGLLNVGPWGGNVTFRVGDWWIYCLESVGWNMGCGLFGDMLYSVYNRFCFLRMALPGWRV